LNEIFSCYFELLVLCFKTHIKNKDFNNIRNLIKLLDDNLDFIREIFMISNTTKNLNLLNENFKCLTKILIAFNTITENIKNENSTNNEEDYIEINLNSYRINHYKSIYKTIVFKSFDEVPLKNTLNELMNFFETLVIDFNVKIKFNHLII
jgi:hypothetical protein